MTCVVVAGGSRPAEPLKPTQYYGGNHWPIPSTGGWMSIVVDRFTCKTLADLEAALDEIDALLVANVSDSMSLDGVFGATHNG